MKHLLYGSRLLDSAKTCFDVDELLDLTETGVGGGDEFKEYLKNHSKKDPRVQRVDMKEK